MSEIINIIPIKKAVDQLGVSRTWIYDQNSKGVLSIVKIAGKSFLKIDEINSFAVSSCPNKTNKNA